jgi:outer membrane protein assembly factor BamA
MKNKIIYILLILSLSLFANSEVVVLIKGNTKTLDQVILNQSKLSDKDFISDDDISVAKRRLINTGLFSNVNILKNNHQVIIEVKERWTTIPILKFSSGGGVGQVALGLYDPNIAGKYIEAGGQYTRLGKTNSGVAWLKIPNISNSNWGLDFQLWKTNRLRTKYDQGSDTPLVKTGFLQTRDKFYSAISYEFTEWFTGKVSYEFNNDEFSDKLVPVEAIDQIQSSGLPPRSKVHLIGVEFNYGNLIDSGTLQEGMTASVLANAAFSEGSNVNNFFAGEFNFLFYKTILDKSTFAFRFNSGLTNTNVLQYWYYIGGLNKIRGFADNRFAGRYFWLANTEFRHPFITRSSFSLQAVTFVDITTSAEAIGSISSLQAASFGGGLRIILPKLYRFVLRIDYAKPIKKEDDNVLSFGVQQFF